MEKEKQEFGRMEGVSDGMEKMTRLEMEGIEAQCEFI